MTVTSHVVEHHGATTHYLDCRPDGARADGAAPIVFVPGMTCIADDYRSIAEHTGRRTLVIELRGHGVSSATSGWDLAHHALDIDAVVGAAVDGPLHLMTFSRGTCYALAWCRDHTNQVRSLTIGDYPAREIGLTFETGARLLDSTWRGTPVRERVDASAFNETIAASADQPLWHVVAGLDVSVTVVRSSASVPMNDDDWRHYEGLVEGLRRTRYDDSPHDIFRPDRGRYPRLVAGIATAADRRVETSSTTP